MTWARISNGRTLSLALAGVLVLLAAASVRAAFDPARLESWKLPEASLYAVTASDTKAWAAGYWGTILLSNDSGRTWTQPDTPTAKTLFGISFADDKAGWAVGADGTILRSTDGGATWTAQRAETVDEMGQSSPIDVNLFSVAAVSATEAWIVGDLGIVLRTRDGEKWESVVFDAATYGDDNVAERLLNSVVFTSPTDGWIGGEFATLLRTTDGGQTWVGTRQIVGAPGDLYVFNLSASPGGPAAAVGLAGSVLVSADGGAIWESRSVDTSAGLFAIAWNGLNGVAAGDRGVLYMTSDGGQTWTDAKRPKLFNWLAGATFNKDGQAIVVGERGIVLRSEDRGASWTAAVTPSSKTTGLEPPISLGGAEGSPADVSPAPGVP